MESSELFELLEKHPDFGDVYSNPLTGNPWVPHLSKHICVMSPQIARRWIIYNTLGGDELDLLMRYGVI